jgi:hypothetical protein
MRCFKVCLNGDFVLQNDYIFLFLKLLNNFDEIWYYEFKVCKSVHHHTIQINQPISCNNFSSLLLDVYVQLNMFRAS